MGRIQSWLAGVPGRDAIERRQAYLLQLALIVLTGAFLFAYLSNVLRAMTVPGTVIGTANSFAAVATIALIVLLRRGRFRIAAIATVVFLILSFGAALTSATPALAGPYLALLMVPIVLAGLTLPRTALIATWLAVVAAGLIAAYLQPAGSETPLRDVMGNFVYASLFITAVVFGFGGTLRETLARVSAHEIELETARAELEDALAQLRAEADERRRLQDQLSQSQRLESIGRLAGGVAHDFNNLLTAIIGYADLLEDEDGDKDRPEIEGIRTAADQAASLTRQLLAFSRNQELRLDVVDVSEVVEGVKPLLRRLIGEQVELVTRPAADVWPVLADRSQLEAVIVNLAVNARDAMPAGGTLTIETSNVDLDETYVRSHGEVRPGPYAMVAVSDTGSGMDTETLSHIFEPFFTTKELGKGTGLGLATVYGTVRQSGGHIWVYSEPEHGTSFKIYLPKTERSVAEVGMPSAPADAGRPRDATVLLAEDEELVRTFLVTALERAGYRVVAVDSAEAALRYLEPPDAPVGVLVSDVVMPGMSGPELLDAVWKTRPGLPAIFMSGYTAAAMEQRPMPEGLDLLEKPFTSEQLQTALDAALGRAVVDRPGAEGQAPAD